MIIRAATAVMPTAGSPPVALAVAVGSGAGSTLQPQAALYLSTSVVTLGTHVSPSRPGIGGSDGTTQRAMSSFMESGTSSSVCDAGGQQDSATAIQVNGPANVNREAEARWASWRNGGSDLEFDDVAATAMQLVGLHFFGGEWDLVEFTGHATADSALSVTGLAFVPNIAILFSHYDAFSADGSFTDMRHAVGFAVKTPADAIQQVAFTKFVNSRNGLNTANAAALRDDSCLSTFDQAADSARLELTAWTSDGATFTTRGASVARSTAILFGRIPNVRLWAGVLPTSDPGSGLPWLSTASTGLKTVTVGIKPASYCLIGTGLGTKNTRDTTTATNGWSYGWWTGHEQFVQAGHEPDNAGTVESTSHLSTSELARVISLVAAGAATTDWAASHSSAGDTGPVISIDTASAAGRLTALLVIGEEHAVFPSESVAVSDAFEARTTLVTSEDVQVSDAALTASRTVISEDVQVSDAFLTAAQAVIGEDVAISDSFEAHQNLVASESVAISDDFVLHVFGSNELFLVADETVAISDSALLVQTSFEATESVAISDAVHFHMDFDATEAVEVQDDVRFRGTGVAATANEDVLVSDGFVAYLGQVLVTSEDLLISDSANFGDGPVARITGSGKGKTVQAGAEMGVTAQAGSRRGATRG